ncbi:MAG: YHYH protein [Alphaproteobacteria bacterium]|nr:YHYH protein [Alphaproteobacteria bacterium]MCB9698667.1 YHYH protein [Alphaproteobacteria bacterium]
MTRLFPLAALVTLVACAGDAKDTDTDTDEADADTDADSDADADADSDADTDSDTDADTDADTDTCSGDDSLELTDVGCSNNPTIANDTTLSVAGGKLVVTTNGVPNHTYTARTFPVTDDTRVYEMPLTPSIAPSTTSILRVEGFPAYAFGVGVNGVKLDPAPAEPFIFEDTVTGEYNWDWVFEPTNNLQTVALDCNTAHVQPDGTYHYHGDLVGLAELLSPGISSGTVPAEAVVVGYAADGFPIVYRYGPDGTGAIALLEPGYELKAGDRPGDGVSEPCGTYNGKYTNDYEWTDAGDLDACNGVERTLTVGPRSYDYFYVVTDSFPQIPRCFVGTPDASFEIGP